MPIHYALFENNVSSDPNDYAAIVKPTDSVDLDRIVDRMVERGSTTTRADILAVLEDAIGACESILLDGMRVNVGGLVELFPRVKGVFVGATDAFDPARHKLDLGANPGVRVRNTVRDRGTVEKDEAIKPAPNPIEFRDVATDTINQQFTGGNIGQLSGSRLKFDKAAADEGVYLIAVSDGAETKISVIQKNKPSQSVFLLPVALPAGDYHLEVRARMGTGTAARELRIGRLDGALTALP